MVETQYGKYTYNSPSLIRRTTHKLRLTKSIQSAKLKNSDNILDFGAGDGYLGKMIYTKGFHKITCYEPVEEQFQQMKQLLEDNPSIRTTNDLADLTPHKFDVIFCLEVMEHLTDATIENCLENIKRLLTDNGKILISVPWESGLNGFVKNCIKKTIDKDKTYSYSDLWKIAFNKKNVPRKVIDFDSFPYIIEHFGFNNYHFEKILVKNKLLIAKKTNFPFRIFSSQIFYLIQKND